MRRGAVFALAWLAGCAASTIPPAPGTVNGCAGGDFVPATSAGAARIQYGDPLGLVYSPKCLTISAGESVTFFGDTAQGSSFAVHPLRPGGASGSDPGAGGNPIAAQNGGATYTVTFPSPGTYGYFCLAHEGMGMYGAVQVK